MYGTSPRKLAVLQIIIFKGKILWQICGLKCNSYFFSFFNTLPLKLVSLKKRSSSLRRIDSMITKDHDVHWYLTKPCHCLSRNCLMRFLTLKNLLTNLKSLKCSGIAANDLCHLVTTFNNLKYLGSPNITSPWSRQTLQKWPQHLVKKYLICDSSWCCLVKTLIFPWYVSAISYCQFS